jgi:hypothetical protein
MEVIFKKTEVPIETRDGKDTREMDIVEISYPDGKVIGFPADAISPETGMRYRDMYQGKYDAFKNGEPDPSRVAQLQQEIADRQAELDGIGYKAPDDERVQGNLGYGEIKQDEAPHDASLHPIDEPHYDQPVQIEQPAVLHDEGTVTPIAEPAPTVQTEKVKESA